MWTDVNGSQNIEPNRKPKRFPYKFRVLVQKLANRTVDQTEPENRKLTESLTSLQTMSQNSMSIIISGTSQDDTVFKILLVTCKSHILNLPLIYVKLSF